MRDSAYQRAWIADSLEITLRSLIHLSEIAVRGGAHVLTPIIRDLADHAVIWVETLHRTRIEADCPLDQPPDPGLLEAAAFASRVAAGLAARLGRSHAAIGPEARRAALACVSDLENHLAWASSLVRRGERLGAGEMVHALRSRFPTQSEFLRPAEVTSSARSAAGGLVGMKTGEGGNGPVGCSRPARSASCGA